MTAFYEVTDLSENKSVMLSLEHIHAIIENEENDTATLFAPSGAVTIPRSDLVSMIHASKTSYFKKESSVMTDEQVTDMLESEVEDLIEEGGENA